METTVRGMQWLTLDEAVGLFDEGTRTTPAGLSAPYLEALIHAGVLHGREVPGSEMVDPLTTEISASSLADLIERDLESFIRRDLDELEDAS